MATVHCPGDACLIFLSSTCSCSRKESKKCRFLQAGYIIGNNQHLNGNLIQGKSPAGLIPSWSHCPIASMLTAGNDGVYSSSRWNLIVIPVSIYVVFRCVLTIEVHQWALGPVSAWHKTSSVRVQASRTCRVNRCGSSWSTWPLHSTKPWMSSAPKSWR